VSGIKLFCRRNLDLQPKDGNAVLGLGNTGFSETLGAGIGVFGAVRSIGP
jgi:hypothetical protein